MKFGHVLLVLALCLPATTGLAQTSRSKAATSAAPQGLPSAAQRAARTGAREQALAELDEPDRLRRLSALEDILNSKDPLLIQFAIRKVLAGTDSDMKSQVILNRISTPGRQFILDFQSCRFARQDDDECPVAMAGLGGSVPVYFASVDKETGQFQIFNRFSTPTGKGYLTDPGTLTGTTLRTSLDMSAAPASGGYSYMLKSCAGSLELNDDNKLSGTFSCQWFKFQVSLNLF